LDCVRISLQRHFNQLVRVKQLKAKDLLRSKWICSDILLLTLMSLSPTLKEAVGKLGTQLDYNRLGAASIEDFQVLLHFVVANSLMIS
jgi:hypothetical protein